MRIKGVIEKDKEYLDSGENPPKGVPVHTGPKQGKFYNTEEMPQSSSADETIKTLANKFRDAGFKLYEVGGSIRDSILGKKSSDADFTTDATPDKTKEILTNSGLGSVFGIGEAFGTVGLHTSDGEKIEITTFRKEVYPTNSRKPVVEFGKDLKDDLARRDFTFNAMARDASTGELIDPFGGQEDLKNGIIRTVGNSKDRFAEDPLRMLRAVRFASKFGFNKFEFEMPEPEKLQNISKERISEELNKILLSNNPKYGINLLKKFGLMKYVIPEVEELYDVGQNEHHYTDVFNHTLDVIDKCSKYDYQGEDKKVFMLSAMLHDIGKPKSKTGEGKYSHFYHHQDIGEELSRKILTDLRYDNTTIDRVSKIVANHMRPHLAEPSPRTVNRMIKDLGDKDTKMVIDFSEADAASSNRPRADVVAKFREILQNTSLPSEKIISPISGKEIMEKFNLLAGKTIGEVKEFLTNKVMDGELKIDDKDSAYSMAEQYIKEKGLKKSFNNDIIEKSGGNTMWVEGIIKKGSSFSGPNMPASIPSQFRMYVSSPSQIPKGKQPYKGSRGGMFYDIRGNEKAVQGEMDLGIPHEGKAEEPELSVKNVEIVKFLQEARSIKVEPLEEGPGHVSDCWKIYLENSKQPKGSPDAIYKPATGEGDCRRGIKRGLGYLREVAGYELFKFMGLEHLCPPATIRTDKEGIGAVQFWVVDSKHLPGRSKNVIEMEDQINITAFDIVAFNTDRHLNNVKITKDNKKSTGYAVHCIDHGYCFPAHDKPGDGLRVEMLDDMRNEGESTAILDSTKKALQKIIDNKNKLHKTLSSYLDKDTINDVIERTEILLNTGDLYTAVRQIRDERERKASELWKVEKVKREAEREQKDKILRERQRQEVDAPKTWREKQEQPIVAPVSPKKPVFVKIPPKFKNKFEREAWELNRELSRNEKNTKW